MERLEAALAKAREMRKTALDEGGAAHTDKSERSATASRGDWLTLPEISVSASRAQRNRIASLSNNRESGPYDMLRSRALRQMKEKEWTRIAVTSPEAGCGKTTIALNLALSMARQKDLKVMLFDLDLRRPTLQKALGHVPSVSLHEVLGDNGSFTDCAVRMGDNMIMALNAGAAARPAELLQSTRTSEMLNDIEKRWRPDVMVFDMSPMLASDDNVGFLGNVDTALLVAAAESTRLPNIDICEKELAQLTNVLGVVLNKCRYADDSVGYAYGTYG
jgi:capsular exopolysaccharide synthesis family protein